MDVAGLGCPTLKGQVQSQLYSFANRGLVLDGFFIGQLLLSDGFSRFPGEELYAILRAANVADVDLRMNPHDLQPAGQFSFDARTIWLTREAWNKRREPPSNFE